MAREVKINFDYTAGAVALDGIKAAIKKVDELEKLNANVAQSDLTGVAVVITGATPYAVYAYTLTAAFTTGVYTFVYVEQAPNVEGLS